MRRGPGEDLVPVTVERPGCSDPGKRRRRLRRPALLAVMLSLLAGGLAAFHRSGEADPPVEAAPTDPLEYLGQNDEPAPPGWRRGDPGPLRPRNGHVAVWTGTELVIVGGDPEADGAAYDPRRDRWRPIAPPPFPSRSGAVAAWSGREVLMWGGRDHGRPVSEPAVWTGADVLFWIGAFDGAPGTGCGSTGRGSGRC